MNEQSKRVRFHAVDLFLILLALFAVLGTVMRSGAFQKNAANPQTDYDVRAVWSDVDSRTAACLQEGAVFYTNAGERFGEVTSIRRTPHEVILWENGKRLSATYPAGTHEDVFLTVRVRGGEHDGVFLRENGRAVLVGETYRLYSVGVSVAATVDAVFFEKTGSKG